MGTDWMEDTGLYLLTLYPRPESGPLQKPVLTCLFLQAKADPTWA